MQKRMNAIVATLTSMMMLKAASTMISTMVNMMLHMFMRMLNMTINMMSI